MCKNRTKNNLINCNKYLVKITGVLVLLVLLISCQKQTENQPANIETPESITALQTVESETSPTIVPTIDPTALSDTQERMQFDGVTFLYPSMLLGDIQTSREPIENSDAIPPAVVFTFAVNQPTETVPSLMVQALREQNGLYYEVVSEAQRQQVEELETAIISATDNAGSSQWLAFVNGRGIRSVEDSEDGSTYHFQGLTQNGRFSITFTYPLNPDTLTLSQLDQIITTLFVDGSAEALNVASCVDNAEFISNITIPDGTEIESGTTFVKTWRMRNNGTCTWTNVYSLAFTGGNAMQLLETSPIDLVSPGEEIDISVTLTAPEEPGAYANQWQLTGPDQFVGIGQEVYLLINVTSH